MEFFSVIFSPMLILLFFITHVGGSVNISWKLFFSRNVELDSNDVAIYNCVCYFFTTERRYLVLLVFVLKEWVLGGWWCMADWGLVLTEEGRVVLEGTATNYILISAALVPFYIACHCAMIR